MTKSIKKFINQLQKVTIFNNKIFKVTIININSKVFFWLLIKKNKCFQKRFKKFNKTTTKIGKI